MKIFVWFSAIAISLLLNRSISQRITVDLVKYGRKMPIQNYSIVMEHNYFNSAVITITKSTDSTDFSLTGSQKFEVPNGYEESLKKSPYTCLFFYDERPKGEINPQDLAFLKSANKKVCFKSKGNNKTLDEDKDKKKRVINLYRKSTDSGPKTYEYSPLIPSFFDTSRKHDYVPIDQVVFSPTNFSSCHDYIINGINENRDIQQCKNCDMWVN